MHGKLPKEELTKTRKKPRRPPSAPGARLARRARRGRRRALLRLCARHQQQQQRRRARASATAAAPAVRCRCWPRRSSAPTCRSISTPSAPCSRCKTVTVRPQVDGKLIAITFKEGQDVKKGDVLARIDPTLYQAAARPGQGQEGAGRGPTRQRQERPRALREARRHQRHQQAAGRHPEGAGGAVHRAGPGRPGRDRERAGDARLHHDHRADLRPHRPAQRRRGNYVRASDRSRRSSPSARSSRSRYCSTCRSRTSTASTPPSPRGRCRSMRSGRRTAGSSRTAS